MASASMRDSAAQSVPMSRSVRSVTMMPSMIKCETWTPFGPHSCAKLCPSARRPNLDDAKAAKLALPLIEAVAPVSRILPKGALGSLVCEKAGLEVMAFRMACEKTNPP